MTGSSEEFDVVIVGAGVSGVNCAYRLKTELPEVKFTVLEGRDDIGGTWDLFRYPGVRSDSELYTYGFSWHPWPHKNLIGSGPQLQQYIKDGVFAHGLGRYIRLRHKVLAADWSSEARAWRLVVARDDGAVREIKASFLVLGTGYYDYNVPLQTVIPGLGKFKGRVINPQFWSEDYDYSGKRIAVIGSGATTVSLLPSLSEKASQVTIVQRSPGWVVSTGLMTSPISLLQKYSPLPLPFFDFWDRVWVVSIFYLLTQFCKYFPTQAASAIKGLTASQLPKGFDVDRHFSPRYYPWEQRLCLSPEGDYFTALSRQNTHMVTGVIDMVGEDHIQMEDGTRVEADAIVTATGISMRLGGHITLTVDGQEMTWGGKFMWNGAMIQDVPNMIFMFGYTNSAWTTGSECSARVLVRLTRLMRSKGAAVVVPRIPERGFASTARLFQLSSTYIKRAEAEGYLPIYGDRGPWRQRTDPPTDYLHARWGDIETDLCFS